MSNVITPETANLIITGLILPLLIYVINKGFSYLEKNSQNAYVSKYLKIAEDAICTAVTSTTQTFVDNIKKAGTFDNAAMETAFKMAKTKALTIMGTTAINVLNDVYEDSNAWIDNKIEYYVNMNKTFSNTENTTVISNAVPIALQSPESTTPYTDPIAQP